MMNLFRAKKSSKLEIKMRKIALLSLCCIITTPFVYAQVANQTNTLTSIEASCRADDMNDAYFYEEMDDYSFYEDKKELEDNKKDWLSSLAEFNLSSNQETLIKEWQTYNTAFEEEWVKMCIAHPNKHKSLADQLNWDEANLKLDLDYIVKSRVFIAKVNNSLNDEQKQQLVQLGLMQLLP